MSGGDFTVVQNDKRAEEEKELMRLQICLKIALDALRAVRDDCIAVSPQAVAGQAIDRINRQ